MSYDITQKRAHETAQIELVNGDGSPMCNEAGAPMTVTVHGPGSKLWQQADAERNRRRTMRIEKNRGRLSAALDHAREDDIDFLCAITVSFNGWHYPAPGAPDEHGNPPQWPTPRDMHRAAYSDDAIGFIRDHVAKESNDWTSFTKGSATS